MTLADLPVRLVRGHASMSETHREVVGPRGEYMRDYKFRYPEKYEMMQLISKCNRNLKRAIEKNSAERIAKFSKQLSELRAKRRAMAAEFRQKAG